MEPTFRLEGRGSDLAIHVRGASAAQCLAAAVEGLAASVGEVSERATRRRDAISLAADSPPALLVDVLDEVIGRLDADGELGVALHDAQVAGGTLHGTLELVRLDAVTVHGDPPKAATWHGLRLEPVEGGWQGHVLLDL